MTQKPTVGFKATASLNRYDFKVGNQFPEGFIGNEVEIVAVGEFTTT